MVDWPASLPKCALPDTRRSSYAPAANEFAPDDGRPIRRVTRSTADRMFGGTFSMTTAQLNDFWTFWNTTVSHGVGEFAMWDPEAGETVTVIFQSPQPPVAQTVLRGRHLVDLAFRVVS